MKKLSLFILVLFLVYSTHPASAEKQTNNKAKKQNPPSAATGNLSDLGNSEFSKYMPKEVVEKMKKKKGLTQYGIWAWKCHRAGIEVRDGGLSKKWKPKNYTFCSPPSLQLKGNYLVTYRQIHVLVHNFFNSKSYDVQNKAREILETYECENRTGCEEFRNILRVNIKRTEKLWTSNRMKGLLKRAKDLLEDAEDRWEDFELPEMAPGLCKRFSNRTYWLSQIFTLYCPRIGALDKDKCGRLTKNTDKCSSTYWLDKDINFLSHQVRLKNYPYKGLRLENMNQCRKPWRALLFCEKPGQTFEVYCGRDKKGKSNCYER